MKNREYRILTALALGHPLTSRELSMAVSTCLQWTQISLRQLFEEGWILKLTVPHPITGKLTQKYALTKAGVKRASQTRGEDDPLPTYCQGTGMGRFERSGGKSWQ